MDKRTIKIRYYPSNPGMIGSLIKRSVKCNECGKDIREEGGWSIENCPPDLIPGWKCSKCSRKTIIGWMEEVESSEI